MDLLGYAALGGLERIAIIAGALVVGYWGYRLYAREQSAGLLFMGLACLVLIGALLTSGRHVRAVGESMQLARGAPPGAEAARAVESGADDGAGASGAAAAPAQSGPPASGPPASGPPASEAEATAAMPGDASTAVADSPTESSTPDAGSASGDDTAAAAPAARETEAAAEATGDAAAETAPADGQRGLASAQELGGRIVSVKSANVTLEWTEPPARSP